MKIIALIDDDPDSNLLLDSYLSEKFHTLVFESATTALKDLQQTPLQLIILDISMPDMDGVEALNKFRGYDQFKKVPIIALTGFTARGDEEKFLELGFDDYIAKPITNMHQLIQKLESIINE